MILAGKTIIGIDYENYEEISVILQNNNVNMNDNSVSPEKGYVHIMDNYNTDYSRLGYFDYPTIDAIDLIDYFDVISIDDIIINDSLVILFTDNTMETFDLGSLSVRKKKDTDREIVRVKDASKTKEYHNNIEEILTKLKKSLKNNVRNLTVK